MTRDIIQFVFQTANVAKTIIKLLISRLVNVNICCYLSIYLLMRMFKTPTLLLLLCLLATQYVREGAAQDINTTLNWVRIDCCQMLGVLTTYTVQSTGDKVDLGSCRSNECLELQIVQLFVNHTRSMLDPSSSFGSSNIESVRTSATHIEIMSSVLLQDTRKMLVLALLGRASLPENLREEHASLEYNHALDILSVRDSFCSTDKTIYSTIVIASISLLVFFIACQIVQSENHKQSETQYVNFTDAIVANKTQANMRFLRMNVNR